MNKIEKFNTAAHNFLENNINFKDRILLYYDRNNDIVYNFGKINYYSFDNSLNICILTSECTVTFTSFSFKVVFNNKREFLSKYFSAAFLPVFNDACLYVVDDFDEEVDSDAVKLFEEVTR